MEFKATLQPMQVLVRHDRQVTLSGDLSTSLQEGSLRVRGDLKVDRAAIVLPDAGAPTLGDDVKVVRDSDADDDKEARGQLQTAKPMDLVIKLDLGQDLALQGHGITTRLEGELTVRNADSGNDPVSVVGEIRTDQGRYRAWGQALNVETGEVLFNGPYGNPSLNLLAIRPDIDVRAGVRVTGTLLAPQVKLYSEPDMPEAEKLSWVVLGRAPAASSAEGNSMQQAALGLLAGQVGSSVAAGLGLDEVGLSDEGVSVGKRLGDELYVTYVAGLSGAASTLYLFYDITRRLTVRGQTGDSSAVDLIYTVTFD
jgi:translocation and assembly module TamB